MWKPWYNILWLKGLQFPNMLWYNGNVVKKQRFHAGMRFIRN